MDEPAQERANILIVDDRPDKHVVFRAILEDLGQNLISVSSGEEALRQVLQRDFAVILLDVNMPGLDGLETAALIRGRQQSAHVPIIFITADYGDEVRTAKAYSLGAVDFMASPVIPEILRSKVNVFVDLYLLALQSRRQVEERVALAEERAARTAAERASQRSAFLARASVALSGSLNFNATMRELARLAIPFLADIGAITLPKGEGVDARTEAAWSVSLPEQSLCMETWTTVECEWWREAIDRVMTSGIGESFVPGSVASAANPGNPSAAMKELELPSGLKIDSLMILPLVARGRTVGVLSLGLGPSARTFDPDTRTLAIDLAGRAAIALDNALLFHELQDQDRRKNEFLAMLSHELRNPLAPIANAVHVLQAYDGDTTRLNWAQEVLSRQVKQLNRLVDDLLDVSRITQGKIELKVDSIDIAEVVAVAVETARPFIDAQQHTLTVKLPPHPVRTRGDFSRLAQILANLLNNAAKYTDKKGRVTLEVTEEGNEIVCRVRDTGIGIPLESQATIFDLFRQLGDTVERSQGGLGIGLTLVKRLVEMHGGTIKAISEGPGLGSEFILRLPLVADVSTDRRMETQPATDSVVAGPRKKHRILVADDNVDLAASMGLLLEMMGNEVRVTHDGMTAVVVETEFRPDIVFLDIGMAKLNGYETCRSIRGKQWGRIPIIVALTGWGQAEDKRRSREAGFDHHLVKPIEPAALERFLAELEPQAA
jgi:signal transduction histidine kinase